MATPAQPASGAVVVDLTAWPAARAVDLGPGGTGGSALTRSGFLLGWSIRETTGSAAADVTLRDGRDASGQRLADIAIAEGSSDAVALPPPGVQFLAGLYADVSSGSATGVAWWVPLTGG